MNKPFPLVFALVDCGNCYQRHAGIYYRDQAEKLAAQLGPDKIVLAEIDIRLIPEFPEMFGI